MPTFHILPFLSAGVRNIFIYAFHVFALLQVSCKTPVPANTASPHIISVQNKNLVPEGIAVDPASGEIYLSSLHENKIVVVDKQGNCKDLISSGQNGFMKGLGIKISRDGKTLWACSATLDTVKSTSGLFQVHLASGKITKSVLYNSDSASLFNDLAIHSGGDIYLTDTYQNAVFKYNISSDSLERWLVSDQLSYANGITFSPDEKILFVASGNKGVQRINMQTKQIMPVTRGARTDYAIDGLLYHNKSLVGIIGWPQEETVTHRIIRYNLSEDDHFRSADTIVINKPYLIAPTTAAMYKNYLYFLGKTNLGLYNRGGQSLEKVRDLLDFPQIVRIRL